MTDSPAPRLRAFLAGWRARFGPLPGFIKIRIADLEALLDENDQLQMHLAFIAQLADGISDSADGSLSLVGYSIGHLANGRYNLAEAINALPAEWKEGL